jgi:hypothetical protein
MKMLGRHCRSTLLRGSRIVMNNSLDIHAVPEATMGHMEGEEAHD